MRNAMTFWTSRCVPCLLAILACSATRPPAVAPIPGLRVPGQDQARWYARQRDSLSSLDAVKEANDARARGDCRLLGVVTLALVVPGAGPNWREYRYGVFYFPGTGDMISSPEQGEYQGAASAYAARYNATQLHASTPCKLT